MSLVVKQGIGSTAELPFLLHEAALRASNEVVCFPKVENIREVNRNVFFILCLSCKAVVLEDVCFFSNAKKKYPV